MAHLGDGVQVGSGSVRGGAGHEGAADIGVFFEAPLEGFGRGRMREVALGVPLRFDPHRLDAGQDQTGHHGFVRVPSHKELLAVCSDAEHGGFHRERAAAGGEEGVLRVDGVRHQLFRSAQHILRSPPVVQAAAGQNIAEEDSVSEDRAHGRICSARLLVAGRRESEFVPLFVRGERVQDGRFAVVHRHVRRLP